MAQSRLIILVLTAAAAAVSTWFAASVPSGIAAGPSSPPVCLPAIKSQRPLTKVKTAMLPVSGHPFGVAITADGRWSFVSTLSGDVAVIANGGVKPRILQAFSLAPDQLFGDALTHDGRYLVVADGNGAAVLSVSRLERRAPHPLLGRLSASAASSNVPFPSPIEVAISPDDGFAFVSLEAANEIAVFNLRRAIESGFRRSVLVGTIPLGPGVVGMDMSPDGNWLYATSEGTLTDTSHGLISVINLREAKTRPSRSVVASAAAGCYPVRPAASPDGNVVWVSARESNSVLAFSASRLRSDPRHALLASVRVGSAPVGLVLLRSGTRLVVADSNRFNSPGQVAKLTLIDTRAALAHKPAVIGSIPSGIFPREMSIDASDKRLLVSNYGSDQLEVVDTSRLP